MQADTGFLTKGFTAPVSLRVRSAGCREMAIQPVICATRKGGISATPQTKQVTETEMCPTEGEEVSVSETAVLFSHW